MDVVREVFLYTPPYPNYFDYLKFTLFHLDSGLWFIFTLWTLSLIFLMAKFVSERLGTRNEIKRLFLMIGSFVVFAFPWVIVGWNMGFDFLGIKFTLYYSPFYLAGTMFGIYEEKYQSLSFKVKTLGMFLLGMVYFYIISTHNMFLAHDGIMEIALRVISSFCGCIFIIYVLTEYSNMGEGNRLKVFLCYCGQKSLEIYIVHYLFLNMLSTTSGIHTLHGIGTLLLNYVLTISFTLIFAWMLGRNSCMNLLLFGKKS